MSRKGEFISHLEDTIPEGTQFEVIPLDNCRVTVFRFTRPDAPGKGTDVAISDVVFESPVLGMDWFAEETLREVQKELVE